MDIKSGIYDVIYSGSVIGIIDEPIEFTFPEEQASLKITLDFKIDLKEKESRLDFAFDSEKAVTITMINPKGFLGIGNSDLITLGKLNKRSLHFNYRVFDIKNLSKTIHYTFYLGKEVENVD